MITNKLLSVILGIEDLNFEFSQCGTKLYYARMDGNTQINSISFYDLAFKCKEWAFNNGYYMPIVYTGVNYTNSTTTLFDISNSPQKNTNIFEGKNDFEVIAKACQFILDQKEIKTESIIANPFIISKELLSAVIGIPLESQDEDPTFTTEYGFEAIQYGVIKMVRDEMTRTWEEINIYELAFKCKLWALTAGFEIVEEFDRIRVISLDKSRYIQDFASNNYNVKKLFVACQWILDNR